MKKNKKPLVHDCERKEDAWKNLSYYITWTSWVQTAFGSDRWLFWVQTALGLDPWLFWKEGLWGLPSPRVYHAAVSLILLFVDLVRRHKKNIYYMKTTIGYKIFIIWKQQLHIKSSAESFFLCLVLPSNA